MANGTIAFDTLSTSGQISGTAKSVDTDYIVKGSPKLFLGALVGDAVVSDSLNVASSTDDGTGQYTYNTTNAFNRDINEIGFANSVSAADGAMRLFGSSTASAIKVHTYNMSATDTDLAHGIIICGDLA